MRHSYVGDVGDFGKYGLLRIISGGLGDSRLGVVWYLTDVHEHNNDGKHDGYVKRGLQRKRQSFSNCDPSLYKRMKEIRDSDQLDISMVEDGTVLSGDTLFYGEAVPVFRGRVSKAVEYEQRWKERAQWHESAMRAVSDAGCVLTDPDNGIAFAERTKIARRKPSHKHSYWHEIADYLARGQSVIAYHHLGRQKGGHLAHIRECLNKVVGEGFTCWAIHYRRGTARAFIVIPSSKDGDMLRESSQTYVDVWADHAALVELEN